jgi:PiT family inorganic phosphate transporter
MYLFSGLFLGWALGANDSANAFGTAVSSQMIRYSLAAILVALFVILGAVLQGQEGLETLSNITGQTLSTAFISSLAAAITVTVMTILKLPISTSQAVVGAILGIGFINHDIHAESLIKVVICWIGTPIGGFLFTLIFYYLFLAVFRACKFTLFSADSILRFALIAAGCYGAYALGANNVANVTGVYAAILPSPMHAVCIGGLSIAAGALTYSKSVMYTVGKSIVKLDAFSAFIAVAAHSATVHIYAILGVPVSTSQAIVGAVLGIGVIKGIQTINFKILTQILGAWLLTPVFGFVCCLGIALFF